ncbi:MAG: HAMP domain-containing histidine kinase [Thermoleophilaceae bacterium]|nr:HAMP domain-containing histidine kinase [Thermoleophilaceae bacterium]
MALSTLVSFVALRQLLLVRLEDRVQDSLVQEVAEFRRLAGGRDPSTGRPFGSDVRAIFDTYLARNVPGEGEAVITFIAGKPYSAARSQRARFPLERESELVERWVGLRASDQGSYETPAGTVRYLAVPLIAGGRTGGVFVAANFTRGERQEVDEAVEIAGAVAVAVLLLASGLAYFAAGRVLAPLRSVTETARSIEESDLTRRIDAEGDDEIGDLARTFNAMLDRLAAAFRSQRAFVNDASHELRTPITIVRGHLELMGDDPFEREQTVELVIDELERMNRFVDDMLLLAKAEQPDFLHLEPVDLQTLSRELFAKARGLAPRDWQLDAAAQGTVVADRQRLTQAVMNLAHNAVQHTEEGDRVSLGTSLDGSEVRLWVSDRGPGISVSEQDRIFERFARADGRRRSSGAGLGLAIVRAIAWGHEGVVEVDSCPGAGATFTVTVPATRSRARGDG